MKNRKKNLFLVPGLISCGFFALLGLFLTVFSILLLTSPEIFEKPGREPMPANMVVTFLTLGLIAFVGSLAGITLILLGHFGKFDRRADRVATWSNGVLTESVLFSDLRSNRKTATIGFTVFSAIVLALTALVYGISGQLSLLLLILAVCFAALSVYKWITFTRRPTIRIVEDRLVNMDEEYSVAFDMTTAYFILAKHGKYAINPVHIHSYHTPAALQSEIQIGEEFYVVYRGNSKQILRIYRKNLWSIDSSLRKFFY